MAATTKKKALQKNVITKEDCSGLLRAAGFGKVNIQEETTGVTFVCRFLWCHLWAGKGLSLVKREFISCLQVEKRDLFLGFLLLNCLQLKIIFMSNGIFFVLGWHTLVSFIFPILLLHKVKTTLSFNPAEDQRFMLHEL